MFLLDARRGDTHTKFFPLAGRALCCASAMNGVCNIQTAQTRVRIKKVKTQCTP